MTLNQLLAYINERIKPNDNREITATKHREVLYAVIDYINDSINQSDSGFDPSGFVTIEGDQEITGKKLFTALNALRVGTGTNYLTFGASQFATGIGKILMGNITNDRTWSLPDATGDIALTNQLIELSVTETEILWRYVGDTEWNILLDFSIFLTEETDPIAMAAIGDRQYSEENYVTSDDTLTKSIDDLDKAVQEFDNNSIELPSIELPSIELPSKEITIEPNHIVVTDADNNITSVLLDSEEVPEIGRQIIIEKDLVEKKYTISLDETKVDHNNLLNWEAERHRHMVYDNDLKAYKIND
jgi:hypothetical protein